MQKVLEACPYFSECENFKYRLCEGSIDEYIKHCQEDMESGQENN